MLNSAYHTTNGQSGQEPAQSRKRTSADVSATSVPSS
jgi:hypothetical protein